MTLAKENQASFEEYLSNNALADPGLDLTVTVLTTGFWPSYKSFDLNLPAEMVCLDFVDITYQNLFAECLVVYKLNLVQFGLYMNPFFYLFQVRCVEVFKEFYQTKTKHRKLTWIYSLGTCNISGKFEPKTMELIVTTYQVIFSMLLNV